MVLAVLVKVTFEMAFWVGKKCLLAIKHQYWKRHNVSDKGGSMKHQTREKREAKTMGIMLLIKTVNPW